MSVFYVNLIISIALIVGVFLLTSIVIIDGSVLAAVGELLMFGVIAQLHRILDAVCNGKSFKFPKGDSSVEISASRTLENNRNMNYLYQQSSGCRILRALLYLHNA